MFESAELGHRIEKAAWEKRVPELREKLLDAQYDLKELRKFPVIVVVGGVDGAGKSESVNALTSWLDPRYVQVRALGVPTDEEAERPEMWRFWRALPPKGRLGIFQGSWYTRPILDRVFRRDGPREFETHLERVVRFERLLVDDGALVVKFWLHLSKKAQEKRLEELAEDPDTAWRVTDTDWKHFRRYDDFRETSEAALRRTSTADAPWHVVEGLDHRYRVLTIAQTLHDALRARLDAKTETRKPVPRKARIDPKASAPVDGKRLLASVDRDVSLPDKKYEKALEKWQGRLALLTREKKFRKRRIVAVFEGPDAAGKGGAIRRVTEAVDARLAQVVPIAAPSEEERAQPYLWRFWKHIPDLGHLVVFDRSWYGRVLVERVEGFCSEADWKRAYGEIVDFEEQLAAERTVVTKFWLWTSPEEQLRRFEERKDTPFKRHKITDEDWRNRAKWGAYEAAADEMIERTSTDVAPWTIVPANDKNHARIVVLKTLVESIERALD